MDAIERVMNNVKILYVEDEAITQIIVKKILKKISGKLYIAENGQEGFELFKAYRPDIVITDLRMPIMNGIDMIKKIRDYDQECGIIINTEVDDIEYIIKSVDIGIDKYLVKPIEKEEIIEAIKNVLKKVIKRKNDKGSLCEFVNFSKEHKLKITEEIKTKISFLVKKYTRKGPKDVQVFWGGSTIEINTYDILTPMEKAVIKNNNNVALIEYYREVFYEQVSKEFNDIISEVIGFTVEISQININVIENTERIIMKLNLNNMFK
ncbi:Na-translocating system protein MpsC family protein [Clostridium sporogenes]|uniref:Na-translocating system protein MpsC family protein n=1 Tax=Clostridium sporogenes TaxID=1509 RepID=UPI0013C8E9F0|nr:Na-translocating system protein MpsC family protein [Clostridium sporogenes]NFQ03500.1 response regulator [Clostridium sporogenes]NFQ40841.1 response regulator [Clostridium sporogenes]